MVIMTLTAVLPPLRPPPCTNEELQQGQRIPSNNAQLGVLIVAIFWLSIGNGGIKPCSVPFCVDQFDLTTEEGRKQNNSFYNLYYSIQTVVLMISQAAVIYIQNDISWALGLGIPALFSIATMVLFFIGARVYVYIKPEGSAFTGVAQVLVAAYRKRRLHLPVDGVDGQFYETPSRRSLLRGRQLHLTTQYSCLNKAALVMGDEVDSDGSCSNPWRLCTIRQVEDVKCLLNIFTIFLTSILSFLAMNQQGTFTVSQALKMDLRFGSYFKMPAGLVGVITLSVVCTCLPFYDRVLVPALEKFTKVEGGITVLQRIGIGNLFAVLTMLVSGFIETKRRSSALSHGWSDGASPMWVLWLFPQLVLMGFSEMFCLVGLIEFYNKEFPENMRSIGNALVCLTFSLASYASNWIITVVEDVTGRDGSGWLTADINTSKVDKFYFLIAGISLLNFLCFMFCARIYHYKASVTYSQNGKDDNGATEEGRKQSDDSVESRGLIDSEEGEIKDNVKQSKPDQELEVIWFQNWSFRFGEEKHRWKSYYNYSFKYASRGGPTYDNGVLVHDTKCRPKRARCFRPSPDHNNVWSQQP
ncbi:hypothetical protein V6N13_121334 [Hibiscus sabdariffa]